MHFGLITPVFDGCIDSLELLYGNIAEQAYENWTWVLCGNRFSEKIASFVKSKQKLGKKGRIVYLTTNLREKKNSYSLVANIGKRRDICIKKINADYFLMVNADSKLLDKEMLSKISAKLEECPKNLCIFKILYGKVIYPRSLDSMCSYDGIDSLNFCVSSDIARKVGYPTNAHFLRFNDELFFKRVFEECKGEYCFIDEIFGEWNGNNRYKNVSHRLGSRMKKGWGFLISDYIVYCLHDNYLPGLIIVTKQLLSQARDSLW